MFDASLIALFFICAALLFVLLLALRQKKQGISKDYFQKQWANIEGRADKTSAIIKADALLDEAMKKSRIQGQTMGERLNNSGAFVHDINAVWTAHKLRNRLVHESKAEASATEIKRALSQYKKALKDLGAL